MQKIYMDFAAATPMDKSVVIAMTPFFTEKFYNPSSIYLDAKETKADLEFAREKIARIIGARPGEIVFAAGGTEANNLAINGVMQQFPDKKLIISAVEHDSVLEVAKQYDVIEAEVSEQGVVVVPKLIKQITDDVVLISVQYVNNEVGAIQPIRDIASEIDEIKKDRAKRGVKTPLYFHTDAAQAANYQDLHVSRLGVDLMMVNGGKIYGPKQSAFLYVKAGIELSPLVRGGGQENGLRSGTENVAGSFGLSTALDKAQKKRGGEVKRLGELQEYFIDEITKKFPEAIVNGPKKNRVVNNIHVTFPGKDNERMLMELDEKGIQVATGSACSASKEEASHVLLAMGIPEADARASLRFTMGRPTTKTDIDALITTLKNL
ncbi:MAG: cysteine desulfurase [bacterium]|nr:cysteine desulfurase [bacterium]